MTQRCPELSVEPGEPVVGVLALQGDVREHGRILGECGAEAVPVRRPAELRGLDGIVIPGGESTTMGKLAAETGLLEPLREAVASGLPAYGSCAGTILLASKLLDGPADQHTIGGIDMVVRRNAFGRQVDSFEADLAFAGIDGPVHAIFIRAPWIEAVGQRVEVLARVQEGPAAGMIVAARQGNVLATAFHPELSGDRRVHRLFRDLVCTAASGPVPAPRPPDAPEGHRTTTTSGLGYECQTASHT